METKRVTVQLKSPNPLFEKWIQEMYVTAVRNESKTQHRLNTALKSIKRYPLILNSGSECAILKGFGKNLCKILDKKLKCQSLNSLELDNPTTNLQSPLKINTKRLPGDTLNEKSSSEKRKKFDYIPGYRSGAYAILITLMENYDNNVEFMSKTEIQSRAQTFCDESLTKSKPGSFYSAWSSMKTLISKGFVAKEKRKVLYYSLTESGRILGKQLLLESYNMKEMDVNKDENLFLKSNLVAPCSVNIDENGSSTLKLLSSCSVNNVPEDKTKEMQKFSKNDNVLINNTDFSKAFSKDDFFEFAPHTFDVLLLVDKQETSGSTKKDDATIMELNRFKMIRYELRHLKVGDFTWVARHRETGKELVLPHIVERKRIDDLSGSIKDGRFHEQKFRLKQCGVPNVIYLIESYGNNQRTGLPLSTLMQAATNTRIQDGFMTHFTPSLPGSMKFLAMMTKNISEFYTTKMLTNLPRDNENANAYKVFSLMEFNNFNAMASKSKVLTVKDLFIKQLLQLKGISVEKAIAIATLYNTPRNLMDAYSNCNNRKNPELLLADIKYGISKSNVGPGISRTLYYYFNNTILT